MWSRATSGSRRKRSGPTSDPGPSGRLDPVAVDEGLKALYGTGLFEDVKIRQAGGRLIVTVVEAPVINRVAFEGNKRVKDDQLTPEVQSKPRGTLSRPMVQADVQRIVEIYRRNGRYDVRVDPKIIDLPNNRVDLVFEITEGEKTTVREIRFVGNHTFGDARLKNVIRTNEASILSFIKSSDIYDPDRIEADRDLLRRFYLTKGFADIQIVSAAAEFDPQLRGFGITFMIEEGEQYLFGTVDVLSNVRDVDPNGLRAVLKASSGNVYNAEAIEKTTEEMTIEMSKRGYAFAQVHPRGDRDPVAHRISVVFVVDEGPRTYIERINIRGNTRTRDYVIRREFDIAEGDAYNKVLIDRAERRLKNLELFQDCENHQRTRLRARPHCRQCRRRGAGNRRVLGLGRLLDGPRFSGGSQRRRAQLARSRSIRQGLTDLWRVRSGAAVVLCGAIFPRQPHSGWDRSVCQPVRIKSLSILRRHHLRGQRSFRFSAARGSQPAGAL